MQSAVMQSIVLLIVYCVLRSNLADLINFATQDGDVQVSGQYFLLLDAQKRRAILSELWRRLSDILKNLWARCDCGTTPQRLRSVCSSRVLRCDVNRKKSNLAKLVDSTADIKPVPELNCELSLLFPPNRATVCNSCGERGASAVGRPSGVGTRGGETHGFIRLRSVWRERWGQCTAYFQTLAGENLALRLPGMELNRGGLFSCNSTKWK